MYLKLLKNIFSLFIRLFSERRCGNRLYIFFFSVSFLFFLNPFITSATHISGADISYRWITGSTFEISLTLYRDCSGISAPAAVSINYRSASCGYNMNVVLSKIAGTGIEISQPCSSSATICTGGVLPGIQKYQYRGNVSLPAQCSDWIFSYSICCRNCAITTLSYTPNNCAGVPATYIEATLNNLSAPANSSPVFTNFPVWLYCIGQTFHYNGGVYDADGDSIVYSLINPRASQTNNVIFSSGYSSASPISSSPPVSLDKDGEIVFNPTALEVGVMAILVSEYRNGVRIGTIVRDMELWTQTCTNSLPTLSGINGTNNYDITACPGQSINFSVNSADADISQSLTMYSNNAIPGASFNISSAARPVGTFTWTPTIADARSQPYSFTVTVQDNNCPFNGLQTYSFNITVPVFSASIIPVNSNCASPPTGSAAALAAGPGPFQYLWSNGSTSSSINGLDAGSYSVIVTNVNGCTSQSSVNITKPASLNASPFGLQNVTCNGAGNGSLSVLASGGVAPYTYSWSPSGGTGAAVSGLAAGIYTVTVTDSHGCTKMMSAVITQPAVLSAVISGSNNLCFGGHNGSAAASPVGGTTPYSYHWSNGYTQSSISGLAAGNYSVTITDARGCIIQKSILITQPSQTNIVLTTTPAYCGTPNGSITSSISGGAGTYTYNWTPGGFTTPSISNIGAGLYSVTISDNNGCITTASTSVLNQGSPVLNISSISNASCNGGSNGAVSLALPSGHGPFTYSWLPSGGNSLTASGLTAGNYNVIVTDINNCTAVLAVQINEPDPIQTQINTTNPTCSNSNTGSATISVSGGTPAYSYLWSPGNYTTFSAINLAGGNYKITITDARGCTDTASVVINQPAQLSGNINFVTDVTCYGGNNGAASITAAGGNLPYSYSWFPSGDTLPFAAGLRAGNHVISITDANLCSVNLSFTLGQPSPLTSTINTFGNVSCRGDSSGFANVQVFGGTQPYNYSWSPNGGNTPSITGLGSGNYSVDVTDVHGCSTNAAITISQPSTLSINTTSLSDVSCFGRSDGSVTVAPSGGTAPYLFQWSSLNGNTSTVNNLPAGHFTVIVTDANNCSDSHSITINEPVELTTQTLIENTSCFGESNGSIELLPEGGTPPYNYSWNPGNCISSIASGLTTGSYNVVINDYKGCSLSKSFFVDQPQKINLAFTTTKAACGSSNGSISVLATGGTPGYSYSWLPFNSNDSIISNIPAGVYSITVEDSNGCISSSLAGVSNDLAPEINVSSVVPVSCYGGNNGAATINLNGGIPPIQFSWSPTGGNNLSAANLTAGTYAVTAIDSAGCISVKTIIVAEPPALNVNNHFKNVSCNGGNDGEVSIEVSGGTRPYHYQWNCSIVNDTAGFSLSSGNYSVTVTDFNGCTTVSQMTINQPPALNAVINNSVPVSCFGRNDGAASVTVSGGTTPYHYNWNTTAGSGSAVSGLHGGNYSVTITDAMGCTSIAGVHINEPSLLTSQTSTIAGTCGQANGTASVVLNGGTPPYSYLWNQTGDISASANGLNQGIYNVTGSDMNGCSTNASINVINSGTINASLAFVTKVTCNGGNDASALISVNHGSPPYSYQWLPSGGNAALAAGLGAGSYSVIIKDTNNCTQNINVIVHQPPALSANVIATHLICAGEMNGSANVIASGGTGALSFQWLPGGMNTPVVHSLSAGNYIVKVTDSKSCTTITPFVINEPLPLQVSTTTLSAGCNLSNGSASAHTIGGTQPYHYSWNPGNTQDSIISGIPAGSYTIKVTDGNGCTISIAASVSNLTGPSVSLSNIKSAKCFGGTDGSAEVVVLSGSPPYTYSWFPYGGNTSTANNLSAGSYSVNIRDSNNCVTSKAVSISQPTKVNTVITPFAATCNGGNDGSAMAIAAGGTPPYIYAWSNGSTASIAGNLSSGNYTLLAADSNECSFSYNIFISEPPPLSLNIAATPVKCYGGSDGTAFVSASGGVPGYLYHWSDGSQNPLINNLSADSTNVTVTDANGCSNDTTFKIEQPDPVLLNTLSADVSCYGISDGSAEAAAMGGLPPYHYTWIPTGGNSEHALNLPSGNYTVIARDENGCLNNAAIQIGTPPPIDLTLSSTGTHCFNGNDGNAAAVAAGGVPPYTYFWDNGSTLANAVNLHAGSYIVEVTDKNGCTSQQTILVEQPTQVIATVDQPSIICIGQQVSLEAEAEGGTPGYTYTWNNGVHNSRQSVAPGSTAQYIVYATDSNGCNSNHAFVTVNVYPPLLAAASGPDSICQGSQTVISGLCSGGNGGPYNYSWDNGHHGQSIFVSPQTTKFYTVTVTDNCGSPPGTASLNIFVNPNPRVNFLPNPITGCQPFLVNFHDDSDKDISHYQWLFGDGGSDTAMNPSHLFLNPGNYTIQLMVKNENGCEGKITVPAAVIVNPKPWAVYTNDPETASIYTPEITFTDESINADHWEWNFGDQSDKVKDEKNTVHAYGDTGIYTISLITTSNFGCKDTAYGKVTIKGEFAFYIPNAFSPNNDYVNDVFLPLGIGVKDFNISIYDRWGLMIFSSSDITKGWDGRTNDHHDQSPADVYVYKINIVDLQGNAHDYRGHVTLVR